MNDTDSSNSLHLIETWLPRFEFHVYRDRLRSHNLPTTPTRVAFLYWAEQMMKHCFTWEDFIQEWDNGNPHRVINQWLESGLIQKDFYNGTWFYVTEYAADSKSPFTCKSCNRINIKRLLEIKEQQQ
ncbi:MAG: hypothetical protein E6556_16400 [Pantoea sp.]|nr:hypothetical protein [Pantoea sp.]